MLGKCSSVLSLPLNDPRIVDCFFALGGNSRQHISIYETFLLEDQPTLNRIGEADVDVLIDSLDAGIAARLAGDVVFILQDRVISAWDLVNGQRARWYTQKQISLVSRYNAIFSSS